MRSPAPPARRQSRRPISLIVLGLLAVAAFVLATLPAGLVVGRLERHGVTADAVGGTVWSGRAQGLAARGARIGDLQWSLRPAALLRGALAGHAVLAAGDSRVEADFQRAYSGQLTLESARGDVSLETLSTLRVPVARNWRGRITADMSTLVIEENWPVAAVGTVDLHDLASPPPRAAALGSFRLSFAERAGNEGLVATVTQTDGPLLVDGQLTLGSDRSFLLEGRLAPRGTPSADLARLLQALGPPDADGRRAFSASGTF